MKVLYCIRHGYAMHNNLFKYLGTKAYTEFRDTNLLNEGIFQAKRLNKTWKNIDDIELVIVSPCSRTLETAKFIFKDKNIPIISKDFLIEYPQGRDLCNRRKNIDDLKTLHPTINFNQIENNILTWPDKKESIFELNNRIDKMLDWVVKRPETTIAVISHSSFIGQFKDNIIGDEDNELKYCYPYKIELNYDENKKFLSIKELKD